MSNLAYTSRIIRADAILTNSYVAATEFSYADNNRIQEQNQSTFFIKLTLGSLTSMELKIEYSDDGVDYYQQTAMAIDGGTATMSALEYTFTSDGNYEVAAPFKAQFLRVSVKGTGTASGSSCKITGIIGTA